MCVWGGGGGGADIWGQFCDFYRISADTRGVGTSPASRKTHANQRFIYFKHIDMINVIS